MTRDCSALGMARFSFRTLVTKHVSKQATPSSSDVATEDLSAALWLATPMSTFAIGLMNIEASWSERMLHRF